MKTFKLIKRKRLHPDLNSEGDSSRTRSETDGNRIGRNHPRNRRGRIGNGRF